MDQTAFSRATHTLRVSQESSNTHNSQLPNQHCIHCRHDTQQFTIIAMPGIQCRHRINSVHTLCTFATQDCCHVCVVAGQMETLFCNFKTLLTKKSYYVTHLPYLLALST